jgi:Zn-dependent M28 family amino/carboxypeptidase
MDQEMSTHETSGSTRWRPYLFAPLVIAVLGAGALFPALQKFRSAEANAAMFGSPAPIDGQRAYDYLKQICKIGPRVAGSEANARQRKLVADHFTKLGAKVREQPFRARHPVSGQRVEMANLIGSWHPERLQRVVIGVHYDTRPHPDEETDAERRKLDFLGANDGASGVALLMEIAHHLNDLATPWGVDLVLFDGEELVFGNNPRVGEYFLGSKHFASAYADDLDRRRTRSRYAYGLVLDMVGGQNLKIKQEPNSLNLAPDLVREVWTIADQLKVRSFSFEVGRDVLDDHLALNNAGIPTIDLIDFEYPYWHKADDLPENCSAESLAEVGKVVTAWLTQPRRRTRR